MTSPIRFYSPLSSSAISTKIDIYAAIKTGDLAAVREIVRQEKKRIDAFNDEGLTPLHFALKENQTEIALLLIEAGADVSLPSKKSGSTPLMFAISTKNLRAAIAILELQPGEALVSRFCDGMTPLHFALQSREPEFIELLCRSGADMHAAAKSGITPCQMLLKCEPGWLLGIPHTLLNLLHKQGAFSTPDRLFQALMRSHCIDLDTFKTLVRNMDLRVEDPSGKTWVEILLQNYSPTDPAPLIILRLLFEKGGQLPSLIPPEWEETLPSLADSREKTFCALLDLIDVNHGTWSYPFLYSFAKELTDGQICSLLFLGKASDYFQLIGYTSELRKTLSNIALSCDDPTRLLICNQIQESAPLEFQEEFVRGLLERGVYQNNLKNRLLAASASPCQIPDSSSCFGIDPLAPFSDQDPRCLLRIYIDLQDPHSLFSPYFISFFSRFLTLPSEQVKNAFDGMGLLEYLHCKKLSSDDLLPLFRFALQWIGMPDGRYLANPNTPSSEVNIEGASVIDSFPYTAIYAERFLEKAYDAGLSDEDKTSILKELLDSIGSEKDKPLDLYRKKGFALINTGFIRHSIPVLFFESAYGSMRAVANRGGGRLAQSMTVHTIAREKLSNELLSLTRRAKILPENESKKYLYRTSLEQLDANGCLPIAKCFSDIFNRKDQKNGNCSLIAAKTSFELLMAAKVLQIQQDDIEGRLKEVSAGYKWFTLFTSIALMNDLYAACEQSSQFFDLAVERDAREKVEAKYKRAKDRFGSLPPFIEEQFTLFLDRSEAFRHSVPASLRQQHLLTMQKEDAIKKGNLELVKEMINDPDVLNEKDRFGNTPLQIALLHGQIEIAEWLCQQPGINLSSKNHKNKTALLIAIRQNYPSIANRILETSKQSKNNLSIYLIHAYLSKNEPLIKKLLDLGADPKETLDSLPWNILRRDRDLFLHLSNQAGPKALSLLEEKLFDHLLDDLDVQGYSNQNYANIEEVQARYLDDLRFLYDLGMRWGNLLEKKAVEAFGFPENSQSELLEYIRSNKAAISE